MSKEDSSHEANQISYYVNLALPLLPILQQQDYSTFHTWVNKFEYVADKIKVPDDKMNIFFKNMVDDHIYKNFTRHYPDKMASNLSYETIIRNYICNYYGLNDSRFNRKRFQDRYQYANETIEEYSINLRKLHNKCDYAQYMDVRLIEKFESGIRSNEIKKHLTESRCGSYAETVERAIAMDKEKEKVITDFLNPALSMINTYNSDTEDEFHVWLNKFEYIADMIEVPDEMMKEFFQKMVDDNVHTYVRQNYPILCSFKLTYKETIENYLQYFSPEDVDSHIKRFKCRNQYENETIDKYAKNLLKLLNKCSSESNQNEILCERFFNGIRDDNIRNYLQDFSGLSFEEMTQKAITFSEDNEINSYVNEALTMMNIYNPYSYDELYAWINKFEYVLNKIKIPNNKIGRFFFKMVHDDVHTLVKDIYPDINFSNLSYEDIMSDRFQYFSRKNRVHLYRDRFVIRTQYDDETFQDYINNLKKILDKCNYKCGYDIKLCEQFLCGIRNDELREYLTKNPCSLIDELKAKVIKFERTNKIIPYTNQALSMIHTYNQEKEGEFYIWLNKFEYVADMIEVPDEIMVEFFNEMVDQNVHTSVKQAFPSVNFFELQYEETVNHYLRFFLPNEVDLHIKRFNCRNQYEKETIAKYSYNLKKIYDKCDDTNRQEENLYDKFADGIINDDIRSHLNIISFISFDEMTSYAINMEEECSLVASQMNEI